MPRKNPAQPPHTQRFTLSSPPATDIWRKPPNTNVFNAKTSLLPAMPLSKFSSARITLSNTTWKHRYDQGGLLLHLTRPGHSQFDPRDERQFLDKWIKCGIEFYQGRPWLSTVCCDNWADWSIFPIEGSFEDVTIKVVREEDENGISLWVYWVKSESESFPLREVTWLFADEDWEVKVGAMACRPAAVDATGVEELDVDFWGFEVREL